MFFKTDLPKSFAKFAGKFLCQILGLIKLKAPQITLLKKETLAQVFSCEFCEIFKGTLTRKMKKEVCF